MDLHNNGDSAHDKVKEFITITPLAGSSFRCIDWHLLWKDLNKKCEPLAKDNHFTEGDNSVIKSLNHRQQEKVRTMEEVAGIPI